MCFCSQVKTAVPNVQERTYKKGALLVEQGQVPEGLFLILTGTCELVLLSHLPDCHQQQQTQQQQQHAGSPIHSSKPSFSSKIAAAVTPTGRNSPGLLRTQSAASSPSFAMPKREMDLDFAAQLSDSDNSTESEEGDGDAQQQQQQHAAVDVDDIKASFPFFRVTASADGARRSYANDMTALGGTAGHAGHPWAMGWPSASPPPIQEGVPAAEPAFLASGRGLPAGCSDHGSGHCAGPQADPVLAAASQRASFSTDGARMSAASEGALQFGRASEAAAAAATAVSQAEASPPSASTHQLLLLGEASPTGCSKAGGSRGGHAKSCSVDLSVFEVRVCLVVCSTLITVLAGFKHACTPPCGSYQNQAACDAAAAALCARA